MPVTVNPLPTATVSGTTSVCQNAAAPNITFTGSNGTAPYTFTYTINNGTQLTAVSSGNTATVSVPTTTAGTFTYNLVSVTDASTTLCSATVSGSAAVTVNALPTATITAGSATTFCSGGSVVLTASAGSSYLWSNSATTQSITVSTSGSYSVTVKNANNCSATSAATTVTVNSFPVVPAITGTTNVCAGSTTQLANTTGSGVWSTSNAAIATVDNTGKVTGVATGIATIGYIVTTNGGDYCNGQSYFLFRWASGVKIRRLIIGRCVEF
jgi:hypothetical protein